MNKERIYEIMHWWYALPYDYSNLSELQYNRRQLAALGLYIGKDLAYDIIQLNKKSQELKISIAKKSNEYQSEVDPDSQLGKIYTATRAGQKAIIDCENISKEKEQLEGTIQGNKIILKQVNEILQAMQQDIAELRGVRDDSDKINSDVGTRFPDHER